MKFDRKLEKMTFYSAPPPQTLRTFTGFLAHSPSTRMVWFDDIGFQGITKIYGLDLTTNNVTKTYEVPVNVYGLEATSKGNVYFLSLSGVIGELDTQTGKSVIYPTPSGRSGARRGYVDAQDRLWFAEYFAGKVAMFDPRTKQFTEWPMPAPYADPYDVVQDKNGIIWSGGMVTDYVFRLDPATGQVSKYLLPTVNTNIRRIDVDSSTTPVSVWVGENHHSKITRIELRTDR
jgi:streptogramin lyase